MRMKYLLAVAALIIGTTSFGPPQQPITLQEAFKQIQGLREELRKLNGSLTAQKNNVSQSISSLERNVERNNRATSQQINEVLLKTLPVGSIISFGLEATNLPVGWTLCDGKKISDPSSIYNGYNVPDLRSNFIRGKSSSESLLYSYGSNTHSHSVASHTHEVGSHTHTFTTGYASISPSGNCDNGLACRSEPGQRQYLLFAGSDSDFRDNTSHRHSGTTSDASKGYTAEGGGGYTGSESNLPKYIALNFIIKIK